LKLLFDQNLSPPLVRSRIFCATTSIPSRLCMSARKSDY